MGYRTNRATPEQHALADELVIAALSVGGSGRVRLEHVPQPLVGPKFSEYDYKVAAELATHKITGSCIMFLPAEKAFYFQPIDASFPVAPIRTFHKES